MHEVNEMDTQLKRGFLEICVLASLCRGESYGYQIIQDLFGIVEISESTLYPILKRLLSAQLVTARTSEHNGRLRKYYRITGKGANRINGFIKESEELVRIHNYIRSKGGREWKL